MEKTYKRCDQLFNELNMIFDFNNKQYIGKDDNNKDFNISMLEIQFDSDEEWNDKIEKLKNELKRRVDKR